MSETKKYVVKESFRNGGQNYLPGETIELTSEGATALAAFLEGEAPSSLNEAKDQSDTISALEKENANLLSRLEQAKKDFTALQGANTKTADELKAVKEKLANLGKELGELKKAANEKGGKN